MRYRACKLKSLEKLDSGGEGKVIIPTLSNFSNFFCFQKNSNFEVLKKITRLDFQSNLKKENTEKVRKALVFPHFPNRNL